MNDRKDNPRLQDLAYQNICMIVREVGIKWTRRLHAAGVMGQNYWLQQIKPVEKGCPRAPETRFSARPPLIRVHYRVCCQGLHKDQRILPHGHWSPPYHEFLEYLRKHVKTVLLPCMSTCNIGICGLISLSQWYLRALSGIKPRE
jgi:hypothetical protein